MKGSLYQTHAATVAQLAASLTPHDRDNSAIYWRTNGKHPRLVCVYFYYYCYYCYGPVNISQ